MQGAAEKDKAAFQEDQAFIQTSRRQKREKESNACKLNFEIKIKNVFGMEMEAGLAV